MPLIEREPERGKRFQDFAYMRLSGSNDLIYRAYDLLGAPNRKIWATPLMHRIRYCDVPCDKNGEYEALMLLRQRFLSWGFGVQSEERIKELVDEFFVYHRIAYLNWDWPYRDPDEARALMKEYEDANTPRDARLYSPEGF